MAMCPAARDLFVWQTIFPQESWRISREYCAAQAEKEPSFGHVDIFQTRPNHPGGGFNLDGKIKASQFVQRKGKEHISNTLVAKPVVKLPTAEHFGLTEDKEQRLSEIIDEINARTGKAYDNDVVVKAMLQIRDILMKSERLKTSAKNNTQQDFEFSYFDDIDDALIEGLAQNQDFFSLLLSNDDLKRQVLGIFSEEIYKSLREAWDNISPSRHFCSTGGIFQNLPLTKALWG